MKVSFEAFKKSSNFFRNLKNAFPEKCFWLKFFHNFFWKRKEWSSNQNNCFFFKVEKQLFKRFSCFKFVFKQAEECFMVLAKRPYPVLKGAEAANGSDLEQFWWSQDDFESKESHFLASRKMAFKAETEKRMSFWNGWKVK